MGCLGDWRRGRKICSASARREAQIRQAARRSGAAVTRIVWPAPQSPSPLPLPSPELRKSTSHPLPQPSSIPSPPSDHDQQAAAAIPLQSFDFDRVSRSCNHFDSSQLARRPPVFRCFVDKQQLDVIPLQHQDQLTDEAWLSRLSRIAMVSHQSLCRIIGFSIKGRRRLLLLEAPESSSTLDTLLRHFDWEARLNIALTVARTLDFLLDNSPFLQSRGFGASNVLVTRINKEAMQVKLQLTLLDKNSKSSRAGNIRSYGILLMELLSGKRNIQELLVSDASDDMFIRWATDIVNDRIKLSAIVDPQLLLHSTSLSAPTKLASFALSCFSPDPSKRPSMGAAISLLESLQRMDHQSRSRNIPILARSATFCYDTTGHKRDRDRDLTPPPLRTSAPLSFSELRTSGIRSAGASPARYNDFYRMLPP